MKRPDYDRNTVWKRYCFHRFSGLFLILIVFSKTLASQESRSFQVWNTNSISGHFNNKDLFSISEKIQYPLAGNASLIKYGEIQYRHRFNPFLSWGSGFRLVRSIDGDFVLNEQRPMVFAIFDKTIDNFKITLLNRMEYRFLDKSAGHFRNVEKLDLISPTIPYTNLGLFCSTEFFTKLNQENLHLIRYYAGIRNTNSKHFDIRLFYAFQKGKILSDWQASDVIGLNFGYIL